MSEHGLSSLDHTYTPPFLKKVNILILEVFKTSSDDEVYETLQSLLHLRHRLVIREMARLDDKAKSRFAELELEKNDALRAVTADLLKSAKNNVIHFNRSKVAAKRYE